MGRALTIDVEGGGAVSALLHLPDDAVALYVLAHGAGAGMDHPFMSGIADVLAERDIGTLRFQFPYMERGGFPPDGPPVATAAVRAAVEVARREAARSTNERGSPPPVFAGGKSFGARMTSTAAAGSPLPGVSGLIFLGWPLHPAKKPGTKRAEHLPAVTIPMLFVQGTRDELADPDLLGSVLDGLGDRASVHMVEGGDHGFDVLKRSGRTRDEVLAEIGDTIRSWIASIA